MSLGANGSSPAPGMVADTTAAAEATAPASAAAAQATASTSDAGAEGVVLPPGAVLEPGTASLWHALREVMDPEFPISLVDLGLIYAIRREGGRVEIDLTFTATACPCMAFIHEDVETRLLEEPDVDEVVIQVVWDPPWTRDRMTEKGREIMRKCGVAA